jgi:hypothetical protein
MASSFVRFALAAALAATAVGCNQQPAPPATATATPPPPVAVPAAATPDATIQASVRALRANNVGALLENALPPGEVAKMKADWSKEMNKDPVTDEDRRKFNEEMAKLTAPGAEDKLFAELEPQLKQFEQQSAQQMPMLIAMGQGFVQSTVQQSKDLTEQQKQQTLALVDATAKWAQTAKFTDAGLAKQSISVICKAARDLNLKSIDEARALTYDQAMQKASVVLAAIKQVFALYGLSMDKALDSIKTEVVSTTGDAAKVKVSYTAFDQPFSTESDLVKVEGKWYSKQAIEQWTKAKEKEVASNGASEPASAK